MSKKTLEEKLVEALEKIPINLRLLVKAHKQHERRIARLEAAVAMTLHVLGEGE